MAWLWRLRTFFTEWVRQLAWGYSRIGHVARIVGLLGWLGVTTMLTNRLDILAWSPGTLWFYRTTTAGFFLGIGIVIIYVFATGVAAWLQSSGLWMSGDLEEDREHKMFRLRLRKLGGGSIQPQVSLMAVVDQDGIPVIERSVLPFELHWSHHPGERAILASDIPETVGVASTRESVIRFEGMTTAEEVTTRWRDRPPRTVYFRVKAVVPGTRKSIERWFGLEPTDDLPLHHRALRRVPSHVKRPS